VAMPPAGGRRRRRWSTAGHAAGPRRGPPPQGRPRHPAHGRGNRRAGQSHTAHQRHLALDLLNLPDLASQPVVRAALARHARPSKHRCARTACSARRRWPASRSELARDNQRVRARLQAEGRLRIVKPRAGAGLRADGASPRRACGPGRPRAARLDLPLAAPADDPGSHPQADQRHSRSTIWRLGARFLPTGRHGSTPARRLPATAVIASPSTC